MNQKKTAYLGLFAAIAIIFGYVESLIPFFAGIPGMKLGLANLAVLFVMERYTWKRSGASFHCENFYYRFYVWKRLQYYV